MWFPIQKKNELPVDQLIKYVSQGLYAEADNMLKEIIASKKWHAIPASALHAVNNVLDTQRPPCGVSLTADLRGLKKQLMLDIDKIVEEQNHSVASLSRF